MKALAALVFAAAVAAPVAAGQFPTKPVHIIVPNPAGGTVDLVARTLAEPMGRALAQNVIVEARPGGNTIIGTGAAARAPADGHTILMIGTPFVMNPHLHKLPYDPFRDFVPLARFVALPYVIAVHPSVPAKSLQELVRYAKARPTELHYAGFVYGQVVAESFKSAAGIEMSFVPYQGGVQATVAVVGGHVGVRVGVLADATPHIAAGRLRALGVTTLERLEGLKEVPTVAESGYPGFDWASWIGAAVPAATPKPVVARLSAEMLRGLQTPEAKAAIARLNLSLAPMNQEEFDAFLRSQLQSLEKVIRQAGIKAE